MEILEAFRILKIEKTKDVAAVKQAYRTLLPTVNPEDDEEGFMRLREAYDIANQYASSPEEDNATPIEAWIAQAEKLYYSLEGKANSLLWEEIFDSDLCTNPDTFEEAREQFLVFFMRHVFVSRDIYKLVDEKLHVVEEEYILKDIFDPTFLSYFARRVNDQQFIPLEYLKYRDGKENTELGNEIDEYVIALYDLDKKNATGEIDTLIEEINKLEEAPVYHVFEDVLRAQCYVSYIKKDKDGSHKFANPKEKDSINKELAIALEKVMPYFEEYKPIQGYIGEGYYAIGDVDKAYEIWNAIAISEDSDKDEFAEEQLVATYNIARYFYEKAEYKKAYKKIEPLLELYSEQSDIKAILADINHKLIEEYKYKIENDIVDEEFSGKLLNIELAWKYFQINELQKGIEVLEAFEYTEEIEYEYISTYGRMLFVNEQYEKAIPYLEHWYKLIFVELANIKENKRKIKRRPLCCSYLAYSYYKTDRLKEAVTYMEKAISVEKDVEEVKNYMYQLCSMLVDGKMYQEAREKSEQLIEMDDRYYPAYVMHQRACYELGCDQEVIEDYYELQGVYDNYIRKYLYAAEMLYKYGYLDDGLQVIEAAKENGCGDNLDIQIIEMLLLRKNVKDEDERRNILNIIADLEKKVEASDEKPEKESEIQFSKICTLYQLEDFEKAVSEGHIGIEKYPNKAGFYILLGDILSDDDYVRLYGKKDINSALDYYKKAEEILDDKNLWLMFSIGYCLKQVGKITEQIDYYERIVEIDPDYENVGSRLINEYLSLYSAKPRKVYIDRAIELAKAKVERLGDYKDWYKLGVTYYYSGNYEKALESFNKALTYDENSSDALFRIGKIYRRLQQNDKAIEYIKKSIEVDTDNRNAIYHEDLGYIYEAIGECDKAIEEYMKVMEYEDDAQDNYQNIGRVLCKNGRLLEAIEAYKKEPKHLINLDIANAHFLLGNIEEAKAFCRRGLEDSSEENYYNRYLYMGDIYLEDFGEFDKAIECYDQGIKYANSTDSKIVQMINKIKCYVLDDKPAVAKELAENVYNLITDEMVLTIEEYSNAALYNQIYRYRLGWMYLGLGDYDNAEKFYNMMNQGDICIHCKSNGCFEASLFLAILYMKKGDYEKARENIEIANKRSPQESFVFLIRDMINNLSLGKN